MFFWGRVSWGKGPGARNVKLHLNHLECIAFLLLRHAADPCFWTHSHRHGWKLLKAGTHLLTSGCAGLMFSMSCSVPVPMEQPLDRRNIRNPMLSSPLMEFSAPLLLSYWQGICLFTTSIVSFQRQHSFQLFQKYYIHLKLEQLP